MQPRPTNLTFKIKRDENGSLKVKTEKNGFNGYIFPVHMNSTVHEPVNISSSSEEEDDDTEDEDKQSCEGARNQLVVYNPAANRTGEIEVVPDPINYQAPPFLRCSFPNNSPRVLPSVGAFTVQCANCFKWRLIPTKEKYEEIREHVLERHFVCETAREWRPEISCDDPADIYQDGSKLWAIDKPNIAQPPPGWQRLLRIRGEGSTKFADVYYVAPSGKTLRSMVEIQRFLLGHPEYMAAGVNISQFSFQIPKPLQENYVRKRPRFTAPYDGTGLQTQRPLEPSKVNPIAWAGPNEITDLQLDGSALSTPYFEAPHFEPVSRPVKKKARTKRSKQICRTNLDNQHKFKVKEPHQASYGTYDI